MEIKKPVSEVVDTPKNRPVLFVVSLLLLAGLVALSVYLSFARTAIEEQQKQLDQEIASLSNEIAVLKAQNVEGAQFAKEWLEQLEKSEIRWSKVIKTVQDLLPVDPLTQAPRIQFLSYSGTGGGKLTLSAQTPPGSIDPFGDVSTLLNVFNNSAFFRDAYVPSVSHGLSQSGQDLLTFVFNVTYEEQLPDVQPVSGEVTAGGTTQETVTPSPVTTEMTVTGPSPASVPASDVPTSDSAATPDAATPAAPVEATGVSRQ
jgi:Tfp pilus assembly protein PilN